MKEACQQNLARRRREQTAEVLAAARGAHAVELERDCWAYHRDGGELTVCDTETLLGLRHYETEHGVAHDWGDAQWYGVTACEACGAILTEACEYSCCPGAAKETT